MGKPVIRTTAPADITVGDHESLYEVQSEFGRCLLTVAEDVGDVHTLTLAVHRAAPSVRFAGITYDLGNGITSGADAPEEDEAELRATIAQLRDTVDRLRTRLRHYEPDGEPRAWVLGTAPTEDPWDAPGSADVPVAVVLGTRADAQAEADQRNLDTLREKGEARRGDVVRVPDASVPVVFGDYRG